MEEDRGDAAQQLALDHRLEMGEELPGREPDLGRGGVVGTVDTSIGPCSALITAMSKSS